MHLQVCGGEKKGENTHAHVLARLTGQGMVGYRGGAMRWTRAHNVRVNSPLKSDPKPRRPTASFCLLFLLRVRV
jgi:hypothetical protein